MTQSMSDTYLQIYTIFDHIYSSFLSLKCQITALVLFCAMLTKLSKRHLRCRRNLASKIYIFGRYFSIILKASWRKTSDQLVFITNINFGLICKNTAYGYENNKDIPLLNPYIMYYLRKNLNYGRR